MTDQPAIERSPDKGIVDHILAATRHPGSYKAIPGGGLTPACHDEGALHRLLTAAITSEREAARRAGWSAAIAAAANAAKKVAQSADDSTGDFDDGIQFGAERAVTLIRALDADTPPQTAWRPIETRLKDETRFLAYQANRCPSVYECWWQDDWPNTAGYWQNDADNEPEPTHWMPKPSDPPQPAGEG